MAEGKRFSELMDLYKQMCPPPLSRRSSTLVQVPPLGTMCELISSDLQRVWKEAQAKVVADGINRSARAEAEAAAQPSAPQPGLGRLLSAGKQRVCRQRRSAGALWGICVYHRLLVDHSQLLRCLLSFLERASPVIQPLPPLQLWQWQQRRGLWLLLPGGRRCAACALPTQ